MALFKCLLADPVLFGMMISAQAKAPAIRRLEALPAIHGSTYMGTLDRKLRTSLSRAMMTPNPRAMRRE